jgi:hypothetical protein
MTSLVLNKDPDAFLDYGIDWTDWLEDGDTIAASTWVVSAGVTSSSPSFTDTTTTVWIAGGTVGETYALTNRVTTAAGRIDDRTLTIRVKQR